MKIRRLGLGGLALSLGLGFWACSSDDSSGTGNTAGSSPTGGSSGSNGSSGSGSGGSQNTAGNQSSAGGASGSSSGGGGSNTAGSSGSAGASSDASTKNDATLSPDGAGGSGGGGAFALTSTAYTEGMMIPAVHTCAAANTSPALAWSGAPATTKSFALVFTDKDNGGAAGFVHWVLWDIPPATMSLPAALPAGMPAGTKGSSIAGATGGYGGPCPSGNLHHYIFELYPLDVATLPNANANGDRPGLVTNIKAHQLVPPASLSGTSNAMRP